MTFSCRFSQIILLELTNSVMEDQFFTQVLFPSDSSLVNADTHPSISSSAFDFHEKMSEVGSGGLVDFLEQLAHLLGLVNTAVVFKEDYAAGKMFYLYVVVVNSQYTNIDDSKVLPNKICDLLFRRHDLLR